MLAYKENHPTLALNYYYITKIIFMSNIHLELSYAFIHKKIGCVLIYVDDKFSLGKFNPTDV